MVRVVSGDPLRLLWDALEEHGCEPKGAEYAFRSRCPAHNGGNGTSLSVQIGADGRALVHCHAHGCEANAVAAALGLQTADLFPDGHHRGRRYPLALVRRSDFEGAARTAAKVLHGLEELQEPWKLLLVCQCPYCGHEGAWFRASSNGQINADCPSRCDANNYIQGLLGRLAEQEEQK